MTDAARDDGGFIERVQGRLERLGLTPEEAGRAAGLPADLLGKLLSGAVPPPGTGRRNSSINSRRTADSGVSPVRTPPPGRVQVRR